MEVSDVIENNIPHWNAGNPVICTGYAMNEVLPYERIPHPSQLRVAEYIQKSKDRVVAIRDAFEVRYFLTAFPRPLSAEVVGAWYNACIYQTMLLLLRHAIPVTVNPALTLSIAEVLGIIPEDIRLKKDWLADGIRHAGFPVEEKKDYLEVRLSPQ